MSALMEVTGLSVGYRPDLPVARGFTFAVCAGESVALVGASGSGKSTLLFTVAGLIRPLAGTVQLLGSDIWALGDHERARLRAANLGFVFQDAILDPARTVLDNVTEVSTYLGFARRSFVQRASVLLADLGIADLARSRPGQMSGGQAQRVGVARALIAEPRILLADEPTGNLDRGTADLVLHRLLDYVGEAQGCLLIATHDPQVAGCCTRVVSL